jgi:hypothetical protein
MTNTNMDFITSLMGNNIPPALALFSISAYFDNHLWRIICLFVQYNFMYIYTNNDNDINGNDNDTTTTTTMKIIIMNLILYVLTAISIWFRPHFANRRKRLKKGCIFITGCDSGMGKATAIELAKSNNNNNSSNNNNNTNNNKYEQIFVGCYDPKSALLKYEEELTDNELKYITFIELDV